MVDNTKKGADRKRQMPKSIQVIFNWGMLTLALSVVGGYYMNELSARYGIYIMIVLAIYMVASLSYVRERLEMIRVEHEIDLLLLKKTKTHKMKRL